MKLTSVRSGRSTMPTGMVPTQTEGSRWMGEGSGKERAKEKEGLYLPGG